MPRSAATWTSVRFEGDAEIVFRSHWAGLVEVACGECRVMMSYGGRERLLNLPPESQIALLKRLLELARTEQRNRDSAVVLYTYLERSTHRDQGEGVTGAD